MIIPINLLKTCPVNSEIYRDSDVGDLVNSIGEVGLLQPIVVTHDYTIVSGHRRFNAIQSLGWTEVEVEVKDVDEESIPLYIVLFNQSRNKVASEMIREIIVLMDSRWIGQGNWNRGKSDQMITFGNWRDKVSKDIGISQTKIQILGSVSEFDKSSTVSKLRVSRIRKRESNRKKGIVTRNREGKCEGRKRILETHPELETLILKLRRKGLSWMKISEFLKEEHGYSISDMTVGRKPKIQGTKLSTRIGCLVSISDAEVLKLKRKAGEIGEMDESKFIREWLIRTGMFDKRTIKGSATENLPQEL